MGNVERIVDSPTAVRGDQRIVGGAASAGSRSSELGRSGVGLHWREFLILLFVADAAVVLVAILAAVRAWDALFPSFVPTPFFGVWIGATWALWLLALRVGGAYDLLSPDVSRGHGGSLVRALSIVAVVTIAAYFFVPFTFPRSTAIATPLPVLAGLVLWRWLMLRYLMNWSALHRRLLLLGLDETTRQLAMLLLRDSRHVPYL
ncbi:MAG TPA: hypothetical protein VGS17_05320, partial [Candidatus Limnocylindria bacterium]|nr:hypothetical protein [Candidatus Limnocylindria bacterium]